MKESIKLEMPNAEQGAYDTPALLNRVNVNQV
jgi:hypothetical protein